MVFLLKYMYSQLLDKANKRAITVGRLCYLFVETCKTINHLTGLKELEIVMRRDCDCDCLDEMFGACVHHRRMCFLLGFFQKLSTISCTLDQPLLFTKNADFLPFRKILADVIIKIYYKSSVRSLLE